MASHHANVNDFDPDAILARHKCRPPIDFSVGTDRRAIRRHGSIGMPGLALDFERTAFGARARRVHRSLQRLAASSQPGLGTAEWSDISGDVDGDGADKLKRRDRLGGLLHEYERAE